MPFSRLPPDEPDFIRGIAYGRGRARVAGRPEQHEKVLIKDRDGNGSRPPVLSHLRWSLWTIKSVDERVSILLAMFPKEKP